MNSMDWGDVPTWIGGIFAGLVAVFTYFTLQSQRQQIDEQRVFIAEQSATLALERQELHAAAEDRKWAQARRIRMKISVTGGESDGEGNIVGYDSWLVMVHNGSVAPVHDVNVRFGSAYTARETYECDELNRPVGLTRSAPIQLIGPGRRFAFLSPRWPENVVDRNHPQLYFKDDSGVCWRLDHHGKLEESTEGNPA